MTISIPSIAIVVSQTIITITIGTSSVAKSVVVQPWVSLGVSFSISLSSGLGLSLLYGHDSILSRLLSSGGGGHSRDQTVGKDSMSAGDGDTLIILAAHGGRVDHGVVDGVRVAVGQGKVASSVDKPGLGLS